MRKILCILIFFALAVYGQQERIAIMNIVDDKDSIALSDLSYLTDKLHDIASNILPKNRYGIITQQSVVDTNYIVQGRVGRFADKLLTIKVDLYDVRSSHLIGSFAGDSKDLEGLLSVLEVKAPKLFEDMPGVSSAVTTEKSAPVANKECKNIFNINELVFKIQSGFTTQLKDCSTTLAKNIALAKSPFGKKTELKEPKAFMMECTIDGIKQKLSDGVDEYLKLAEKFLQNTLNSASAADGSLDVQKLSKAIDNMNIDELLNGIKRMATEDACAVDTPYVALVSDGEKGDTTGFKEDTYKNFTTGQRWGTLFLNAIPGVGSIVIMDDWTGAVVQWVMIGVGGVVGSVVYFGHIDGQEELLSIAIGSYVGYLASCFVWNTYRSVTYDKPGSVAFHKYDGFNFAVLPNKQGEFKAYLMFNKGF